MATIDKVVNVKHHTMLNKENYRNIVDCLILTVLLLLFLVLNLVLYSRHTTSDFIIAMILVGTPHAVLLSYMCYKLAERAGIVQCLKTKYHVLKGLVVAVRHASNEADVEGEPDINPFPDRLQNPEKYEPDAQEHTTSEAGEGSITRESGRLNPVYTYGSIN